MAAGCGPEPLAAEGTPVQRGRVLVQGPHHGPVTASSWAAFPGQRDPMGAPGRLRVPASPRRRRLVKPSGAVGLLLPVASAGRDNELTHTGGTAASKQFFPLSCSFLFFLIWFSLVPMATMNMSEGLETGEHE